MENTTQVLPLELVARTHVRESRACWLAAQARRAPDAGEVAKVVVTFRVAGGAVQDVTSTGDPPGYPGLAACTTANVARWRFPLYASFTAHLPFVWGPPPRTSGEQGPY
jgi:hypothetical protein